MYIDAEMVAEVAKIISGVGVIGAFLRKFVQFMERQKAQDAEIENIKKEQCVMCYGLLATLDGLKQLGANGNVTDAYQKLEKHLNKTAHE